MAADLDSFVSGRQVDDNGHVMLRFQGGAKGMLWCSARSRLATKMPCAFASMVRKAGWSGAQEDPNYLWHTPFGEPKRLITRNGAGAR